MLRHSFKRFKTLVGVIWRRLWKMISKSRPWKWGECSRLENEELKNRFNRRRKRLSSCWLLRRLRFSNGCRSLKMIMKSELSYKWARRLSLWVLPWTSIKLTATGYSNWNNYRYGRYLPNGLLKAVCSHRLNRTCSQVTISCRTSPKSIGSSECRRGSYRPSWSILARISSNRWLCRAANHSPSNPIM